MARPITEEEKQYAQELLERARAAQQQIAHLDQAVDLVRLPVADRARERRVREHHLDRSDAAAPDLREQLLRHDGVEGIRGQCHHQRRTV